MEVLKISTPTDHPDFNQEIHNNLLQNTKKCINNHPSIIFMVAPWCGHCQRLKPELETLENKLKNDNLFDLLKFLEINDTFLDDVNLKADEGFPTISFHSDGKHVDNFQGERTADNMEKYIRNHMESITSSKPKRNCKSRTLTKPISQSNTMDSMTDKMGQKKKKKSIRKKKRKSKKLKSKKYKVDKEYVSEDYNGLGSNDPKWLEKVLGIQHGGKCKCSSCKCKKSKCKKSICRKCKTKRR